MKNIFKLLFFCLSLSAPQLTNAWGVWAHQHINRSAIFALPESMRSFYFNHSDFITIQASVPDLRKYVLSLKKEFPRHYFDVEAYGANAFSDVPKDWHNAIDKYGRKKLYQNGILPWYLQLVMKKLTYAFKSHNKAEILLLSADLAHYVGDGFQPLHTTKNYDGQLTGQKGIHALFESRLPEMYGKNYNLHTGNAMYYDNIQNVAWGIIKESHSQLSALLKAEKEALNSIPNNEINVYDSKGHVKKNRYDKPYFSKTFCQVFHKNLEGMIQKQMQLAIRTTASLWYTAWVNAKKPDLKSLDSDYTFDKNSAALETERTAWEKKGVLLGIQSLKEF